MNPKDDLIKTHQDFASSFYASKMSSFDTLSRTSKLEKNLDALLGKAKFNLTLEEKILNGTFHSSQTN